jgi:hypothetical protein
LMMLHVLCCWLSWPCNLVEQSWPVSCSWPYVICMESGMGVVVWNRRKCFETAFLVTVQFVTVSHKLHGTQYTPQLETLFTNIAEHLTTYFTEYLHKIVTLARFGLGSLMMVQMDRNM